MNQVKKVIIASSLVLATGAGIVLAVLSPSTATLSSTSQLSKTGSDSTRAKEKRQSYANPKTSGQVDSVEASGQANIQSGLAKINFNATVVIPPTSTNPGGKVSGNLTPTNETGKRYHGLTFDGGNKGIVQILMTNCTNDTVDMNIFKNCQGMSIRVINCKNIVVINNFYTMTNFGVRFEQCSGIKFNGNQLLNLNGPVTLYSNNFAHFMQAYQCSGHQEYNDNRAENITGVALRPHDIFSVDNCSGIKGDSIQIKRNWFRGGQQSPYPGSGDKGGGIMGPDEAGSYYSITDNILVSCGTAGWQAVGSGSSVRFANNIIYNNLVYPSAADGFSIQGNKTAFVVSENRVYWRNKNNNVGNTFTGGETVYWLGSPTANASSMGITMTNNKFDTTLSSSILPSVIITYHL